MVGERIVNDQHVIRVNKYGFYAVPRKFGKRVVPRVLKKGEVYEPRTLEFICRNAVDGDVVSGGAFVGDFFPAISRSLAGHARLISFEPNPLCYEACRYTIALNGLTNVALAEVGVGEKSYKMALRVHDFVKNQPAAAQSALAPGEDPYAEGFVEVDVVTIDSLVPEDRFVSILHLDVEGYEQRALLGALGVLQRCRPTLIVEGRPVSEEWLKERLPNCRYRFAGEMERNTIFVSAAGC